MRSSKLRRKIAWQAARLMYEREEKEYYRAKMKAARSIQKGWVSPRDLPSNTEIRDEIQKLARMIEGEGRDRNLREMRFAALALMTRLERFRPRIVGSVLTGHVRNGSDIDLHLFSNNVEAVAADLEFQNLRFETSRKLVRKAGEEIVYRHIHIHDRFEFELTVYPENRHSHVFKSSITGKPIERASTSQFQQFLEAEYPDLSIEQQIAEISEAVDRFQVFESLLLPLENVKQNPQYHPEGDALYHSLQVFDLACDQLPYDEEFLLAALLHDVGKAIDRRDHVQAGLSALQGYITERTHWLIAHHMFVHQINEGSIGARKLRKLKENESYEELLLLGKCDLKGRQCGVTTTDLDEALEYIRDLAQTWG